MADAVFLPFFKKKKIFFIYLCLFHFVLFCLVYHMLHVSLATSDLHKSGVWYFNECIGVSVAFPSTQ